MALLLRVDERPQALRLLDHLLVFPLLVTVAEECSEEAGIEMVENHTKQVLVELEGVGELLHDLPDAVDKLKEHGTSVGVVVLVVAMAGALGELVTKTQPLLLNQNLESLQSSVVRVNSIIASAVNWGVRSQPSLQCTTTEVLWFSTLSAIFTAPAKIILTWLSQPVASRLLNHRASSITGKHMSLTFLRLSLMTWMFWMSRKTNSTF